jgi:hypothetical protein
MPATVLATVVLADVPAQAAPVDTSRASQCTVRAYFVDQGPCGHRMIRPPRPSNRGDPAAQACGPLGGPVGAFTASADRLPLPALQTKRHFGSR